MSERTSRYVISADAHCNVPMAIYWCTEDLAHWIEKIGYPQYKECITSNSISGRHLIYLDASVMPDIGITDFVHIKDICAQIRELLGLGDQLLNMPVAMRDPMVAYLDFRRRTGQTTQSTCYKEFVYKYRRWFK
ncbi:sterile alpha motif domain-containing protein 15-like isoform X2 [Dreissena polymorpha]|uniref:sterile alpha motif domain-containing protein 15-like isoform X2 n=1 Tax=Dreissena polymorpha TaxID=45954 RepID=UPI002263D7AB|nr:sterile alpha motif domain-containing protein 15-like isoform X2 [Dreissena polymorpha]